MQQRTYARPIGGGRASGPRRSEMVQQSPFAGLSMDQPQAPASFINAPKSLTNLAQLSGISLVPITDSQPSLNIGFNNSQVIFDSQQQPKIIVGPSGSGLGHSPATIYNGLTPTTSNFQYPPVYNLKTIPSIQLINRVAANQPRGYQASGINEQLAPSFGPNKQGPPSNYNNMSSVKKSRSQINPMNTATSHANDMVQILPVSESIGLNFIPNDARGLASPNNGVAHHVSTQSDTLSDQESDNMSLLKLMAIFNNPAITITPVGPPTASRSADIDSVLWNSSSEQNDARQGSMNTVRNSHLQGVKKNAHRLHLDSPLINDHVNSRIPEGRRDAAKSATNFQLIHSSAARSLIDQSVMDATRDATKQLNKKQLISREEPHTVTLSWSPRNTIAEGPNNLTQGDTDDRSSTLVDPAKMLQEFVAATETDERLPNDQEGPLDVPNFEPHYIMTRSNTINLKPLQNAAKSEDVTYLVFSKQTNEIKQTKIAVTTTKRRLYVPRVDKASAKKIKLSPFSNELDVQEIKPQMETYVSERHLVLSKIAEIAEDVGRGRLATAEPDDIFVDKSKRVMSRIESDMERHRKKMFQKISQRSPLTEEQDKADEESEPEAESFNVDVLESRSQMINELTVTPIQLPLVEECDENKERFMSSVGLISRSDKNKLIAQQAEARLKNLSALNKCVEVFSDPNGDVQRIVDTLIQTEGTEMNLRTDTDIKRNELPFIEGLNRNTSRIKMTYMNTLGLEKRSKRTTLYKVVKPQEVVMTSSNRPQEARVQSDLSNKVNNLILNHVAKPPQQVMVSTHPRAVAPVASPKQCSPAEPVKRHNTDSAHTNNGSINILRKAMRIAQASCREALHLPPNKDEYMKSLGLMAS